MKSFKGTNAPGGSAALFTYAIAIGIALMSSGSGNIFGYVVAGLVRSSPG